MDYSKIKLIVSDMDGTLLNSKHEVSPQFLSLFPKLREKNILFAVASGRQYYSLLERMDSIKEDLIYIAENGAIVMEGQEQKYIRPIEKEIAEKLIKAVKQLDGKYLIVCGRKQAYIENTAPEFMKPFLEHYEKYEVVEDLSKIENDVILKMTICDLKGAEENSLPHVEHFENDLQVKLSGKIWIDFNAKGAQKGNALKVVQEQHNISKEETMAFGDYLNDIELFEHAGIGFAMENAHPKVKKAAEFTTKSNEENGVEAVLEKLLAQISVEA